MNDTSSGRLYVGTSGFAYPAWAPLFYPRATRGEDLLREYAARLPAVELNNTFYQQPRAERVARWLAQTPADFRFVVKAQRGGSMRAVADGGQPALDWLTAPYRLFGERLGAVLFRVPDNVARDDERLARLLAAWPADLPLVVEFQHPAWQVDEVHALLHARGAALCATDLDDAPPPDLRRTGGLLYLRLRRSTYTADELAGWSARLEPFLRDGCDCYVFFRHDEVGDSALRAMAFGEISGSRLADRSTTR
jgi:uncharacterized protein YecE (DUF72 family)